MSLSLIVEFHSSFQAVLMLQNRWYFKADLATSVLLTNGRDAVSTRPQY
jgi:hypothetical protein